MEFNDFRIFLITKFEAWKESRFFFWEECSKWKYKSTKNSSELKPSFRCFLQSYCIGASTIIWRFFLETIDFLFKLVGSKMGSIMGNITGASLSFTEGFFFWTSAINDLCLPTLTEVLSIPSAVQLTHGISYFFNAPLTDWNIPLAISDLLRHMM